MDFELFCTESEARAFIKGMEIILDMFVTDEVTIGEPERLGDGEWKVTYSS